MLDLSNACQHSMIATPSPTLKKKCSGKLPQESESCYALSYALVLGDNVHLKRLCKVANILQIHTAASSIQIFGSHLSFLECVLDLVKLNFMIQACVTETVRTQEILCYDFSYFTQLILIHPTVQDVFLLLCYTYGRNEGTVVILTIQIYPLFLCHLF